MKLILYRTFLLLGLLIFSAGNAQENGGQVVFNSTGIACLSAQDYQQYHQEVDKNINTLIAEGNHLRQKIRTKQLTSFIWPIRQAAGFEYNATWSISNYVDHNLATDALQDWNCGTRTYDTDSGYNHQGVDIFTWPFSWKQVDENQTEVIAAASGQIVFKSDGNFDRNCDLNNSQWNAIFIEHSDGSIAWYGHMKNGGLTSKGVGDSVSQGEFLGVVASSGNSTGPHLHFEVYDENNNLIDPYSGPCNSLNTSSWWQDQRDYLNPGVNAALTHTALPDFGSCPQTEETFESTQFDPNTSIWFIGYYRDQVTGTASLNEIYDPDGNLYISWNTNFNDTFYASWWAQEITINDQIGTWTYVVTYNGESDEQDFNVGQLSVEDQVFEGIRLFPNPTNDIVTLGAATSIKHITLIDALGRIVLDLPNLNTKSQEINTSFLRSGIYFVTVDYFDTPSKTILRLIKT